MCCAFAAEVIMQIIVYMVLDKLYIIYYLLKTVLALQQKQLLILLIIPYLSKRISTKMRKC